jgi:L-ascorbate metabolism protein UlaG (beta-lactamase superfamily)
MSRNAGRKGCGVPRLSLILLAMVSLTGLATAAETLCEPGYVRLPTGTPKVVPVAFSMRAASPDRMTIQWVGHSSFLIATATGTMALTDPNSWHPATVTPDVITISNEHFTHNQARSVPGNPRVLRGYTPEGEWVGVNVTIGDLTINSLPSSGGNALEIPSPNTIFVFRAAGLCIVHLGNLRQPLGEEVRRHMGRPDVLMVPIDGHWTLNYEQIALTIAQSRPSIVLPMHYDVAEHARFFMEFIKPTVSVRTQTEPTLTLTRGTLPTATEVIVLGYRGE